jgi:hypothetical protein
MNMQSQQVTLYQSGQAHQAAPDACGARMLLFPSCQPAAHFTDPACRLLDTGSRLCHRAGGPSAQDTPLCFFQDLVARSVRLLSTDPSQPVNPPTHHQINGQARLQTIGILQAAILDAASALDRTVIHFNTPAAAIPAQPLAGIGEAPPS